MEKLNKMSVEFPGVVESKGDGYALYNGVKLPTLPDDTRTYSIIYTGASSGTVYLYTASSVSYNYNTASGFVGLGYPGENYTLSGGSWVYNSAFAQNTQIPASNMKNGVPTWSSFDIYADSSLAEIAFSATAPIPLDGMQVIEWDGDTDGLANIDNYYKVSDNILDPTRDFSFTLVTSNRVTFSGANKDMVDIIAGSIAVYSTLLYSVYADNEYGFEKGLYFVKDTNGNYLSLLAYTPAAEEDTGDKIDISFNDKIYSIDPSSLSSASDDLKSHLSTVMNGSGATINFDDVLYNIDSTKLVNAQNDFVSHLGTIAGNGHKVTVGGVEYGIDSAKVVDAIAELEEVLERLQSGGNGGNGGSEPEVSHANYLTFSSAEPFTIGVNNTTKNWDGTLEYSTDANTWNEWDGTTTLSSGDDNKLYLRGTENTKITGSSDNSYKWVLTGSSISCMGNIETLLDYETVAKGEHPVMADFCYSYMFYECTSLVNTPELPATTLTKGCYANMFSRCTSLVNAPELPATTLAEYCYRYMFLGCTSLVNVPELPATTLAEYCYRYMFSGCASLVNAPQLSATTLADFCCENMFSYCTNLVNAPELPATTLAESCYEYMFNNCTNLVNAPELPATTLADRCYNSMFYGCTSLVNAPELLATTLAKSCYGNMFYGCTSLVNAPDLPATTLADYCYQYMFSECTSLVNAPELPATTLTKYCYYRMFRECASLKLSTIQSEEYPTEYRIPSSGTGSVGRDSLTDMFRYTGGTFTGTPSINTTYYGTW